MYVDILFRCLAKHHHHHGSYCHQSYHLACDALSSPTPRYLVVGYEPLSLVYHLGPSHLHFHDPQLYPDPRLDLSPDLD